MDRGPIILLMDGDGQFTAAVGESLHAHGYRVEITTDGLTGIQTFEQLQPDLVITEMLLAGRSGFAVVEHLRRRDATLPIIMAATFGTPIQRRLAEFMGATEFLAKPVSVNRLVECVRRLCPAGLNPPHTRQTSARASDVSQGV